MRKASFFMLIFTFRKSKNPPVINFKSCNH